MVSYQLAAAVLLATTSTSTYINVAAFAPSTRASTLIQNASIRPTVPSTTRVSVSYQDSLICQPSSVQVELPTTTININTNDETPRIVLTDEPYGAMIDTSGIAFSGLKGKALSIRSSDIPTFATVKSVVPRECFQPDTLTSFGYLSVSAAATALCTAFGVQMDNLIGTSLWTLPLWTSYAAVTGTVAMGLWVLAHECGHGAFSKNKKINDAVGFVLHSALLVPYYSWQHSHAVHHRYTNDMDRGETHVPEVESESADEFGSDKLRKALVDRFGKETGLNVWGGLQGFVHLLVGWPAYLLVGATGGQARGMTNHFYPEPLLDSKDPNNGVDELFPGKWKAKVYQSDIGIGFAVGALVLWGLTSGFDEVMALYGGPLLVVNAWLVLYTWYVRMPSCSVRFFHDEALDC